MQLFKIIKPIPVLAPYIRYYWILQAEAGQALSERTLPVGCIQLVFHKGQRLLILKENKLQPQSFICGQTTEYSDVLSTGNIKMIVVVFQPYAGKIFFKMPLHLFHCQNIAVEDIDDKELLLLSKQVEETEEDETCIELIERFLLRRVPVLPEYNLKRVSTVLHQINEHPCMNTSQLAEIACLSNKQFSRVFTEYVGNTPKEFMRIVRLHRALFMLQKNPKIAFARLAYECGFSDQSHMIKEFKLFSGYTPTEYLSVCPPYSDYFSN